MNERLYVFDREGFDSIKRNLRRGNIVEFKERNSEAVLGEYVFSVDGMHYFKSMTATNSISDSSIIFPDYTESDFQSPKQYSVLFRVQD